MEGTEDRQRVDRWLEESQYVIGRMIPAYLDDRERVRARLETVEQDNEQLKIEPGTVWQAETGSLSSKTA